MEDPHFQKLTPDLILDAVETCGYRCDGRQHALNSYENRVYQVWLEDGGMLVVKFYRPQRWSDAAILEEHAYSQELAAREIPVVAPLATAVQASGISSDSTQRALRLGWSNTGMASDARAGTKSV